MKNKMKISLEFTFDKKDNSRLQTDLILFIQQLEEKFESFENTSYTINENLKNEKKNYQNYKIF